MLNSGLEQFIHAYIQRSNCTNFVILFSAQIYVKILSLDYFFVILHNLMVNINFVFFLVVFINAMHLGYSSFVPNNQNVKTKILIDLDIFNISNC